MTNKSFWHVYKDFYVNKKYKSTIGGKLQARFSAHVGFIFGVDVTVDVSAAWTPDGDWLPD